MSRSVMRSLMLSLPLLLAGIPAAAQTIEARPGETARAGKDITAVRVAGDAIQVDGRLDEAVWQTIPPVSDFTQKEPDEGALATERTEVRIAYDESALYIGARLYSSGGRASIQGPLGRRDNAQQAEFLLVSLDTYLDRRTAYSFGVTAAGVRLEHFHRSDDENAVDRGFDPVWAAEVTVDDEGWTAEMWIPFSQLRFTDLPQQVWGLNLQRSIPSKNEEVYWVLVPRTEQGWASRFGMVRGIEAIRMTRRVELLPYFAGGSSINGNRDRSNPFDDGRNLEGRFGADLKMGLGPNLTLDATVNPDFGQVEADPAVVNLSADEVFFEERRPFFTEGSDLLSGPTPNYFYSRRIGAPPPGSASGDYVDPPGAATILGAAKVTGRLPSGLSIGLLGAMTGAEDAEIFNAGPATFDRVRVAPRVSWGVARFQQEFGEFGSTASLMFSGVHRELQPGSPLAALVTRNALAGNGDLLLRLAGGMYQVSISAGFSYIDGDEGAILRVQRASPRYFQRPDATHVEVDPTRTWMAGWKTTVQANKVGGQHWLWDFFFDIESPHLEFNDIGRLGAGDGISNRQALTYRETRPGSLFRSYRFTLLQNSEWNFGWQRQRTTFGGNTSFTWNNFWSSSASVNYATRAYDWSSTRGGPTVQSPQGWSGSLSLRNSPASQTGWNASLNWSQDENGSRSGQVRGGLSLVPTPRWRLSVGPSYERQTDPRQYVTTRAGGSAATYGSRYIFAFIDRTTLAMEARVNFTFKPDLNLDVYAQPFASSGRYYDLGEVPAVRRRDLRTYGADGTTITRRDDGSYQIRDGNDQFVVTNRDFNVQSVRSTTVLRWEWRPGSTLYLVWQQDRSEREPIAERAGLGDVFGSLGAVGSNFFAIKATYWLGI